MGLSCQLNANRDANRNAVVPQSPGLPRKTRGYPGRPVCFFINPNGVVAQTRLIRFAATPLGLFLIYDRYPG